MMFLHIFIFELRYRFTRPATYIYFALLATVALILIGSGSTPATEKVFHNSPIVIAELQLLISIFGILLASAVMGVPIYRDLEHKTGTFLFSYPVSKTAYFMGRFWGSFVTLVFISTGAMLGIYLGSIIGPATGWTDAARFGPNLFVNYLQPWLTLVLPNLWMAGCLFFALIIFTRNIKSIYSGGIVIFIGYLLANLFTQDIENKELVQLLDPFALNSFALQVRYLTPFEQNNFLLDVSGTLLMNRILWFSVGLLFFAAAYFRFSFAYFFSVTSGKVKKEKKERAFIQEAGRRILSNFSGRYQWESFKTLSKVEVQNITKDVYFRSILLGGIIFLVVDFWLGNTLYSVTTLPATHLLMEYKGFDYSIFVFIILVFFTGEALHRDKSTGFALITDTFPVKDGVVIASKFMGMVAVCLMLTTIPIVVGLLVQTLKGYFNYDLKVYLIDSYLIALPDYLQMVMLVFAIHLVANSKFAGHAISVGVWLVLIVLRNFANYDFNLFFYSYKPEFKWSALNGLGHFPEPLIWFNLYWSCVGIFLILFFSISYSRGVENSFTSRLKRAKSKLNSRTSFIAFAFLLGAIVSGAYIFNSVVYVNAYLTQIEKEKRQADYEKQLKQYEFLPQPKIVDVNLIADLFPSERKAFFSARVKLVNKTAVAIDSLHLRSQPLTEFYVLFKKDTLPYRFPLVFDAPKFQIFKRIKEREIYKIIALPVTMEPGDTLEFDFVSSIINTQFLNNGFSRELLYNGTFIGQCLPNIGYSSDDELSSDEKRRKYGLALKDDELPAHDDPHGKRTLLFQSDADFIQFEAVLSTEIKQIAIAPGYLQKEWTDGDRRYFHYIQDTPIQLFFSIVSADYEVYKDKVALNNGDEVAIEIFYHKGHDLNLDRFTAALKDGLIYFSEVYGPFQFRQMRIMEFPRYASFAQSFPNTVPYSEDFAWEADFRSPDDLDYVYYVTAHELAHQWWGHQVVPNYTRGSNLISESLAQFSALVLSERTYGKDNMKRGLKGELDRYLAGRSREAKKENVFINSNREYQWYNKGSLILYGLRDLIGEAPMDSALRNFAKEFAMKMEPPFAGSPDLYRHLKAYTPDSLLYYLDDTWNRITLYENKIEEAKSEKGADGSYLVTLKVKSQKLYADSAGMESPASYEGDYIDIGVFAAESKDDKGRRKMNPLYLQKHKLKAGETTLTIKVNGEPVEAGIDPLNKLIDRVPDDNITKVSL